MPTVPVEFHPDAVDEAAPLGSGIRRVAHPPQTHSLPSLITLSSGSVTTQLVGHHSCTRPTGISSASSHSNQVVYRLVGATIQVIAVAHGRRKPGYWKTRG